MREWSDSRTRTARCRTPSTFRSNSVSHGQMSFENRFNADHVYRDGATNGTVRGWSIESLYVLRPAAAPSFSCGHAVLLSADYYVSRHTRDGRCRPSFASFSPLWHVRLMGCDNWCDHATRRVTSVAFQVLVSRLHCMPECHPTAYRLYKLALDALRDEARLELRPIRLLCDGEP